MDWIGITGTMGAGKTTVSKTIEQMGFPVAYADKIARAVLAPKTEGLAEVVKVFGPGVLNPDQTLCREALAQKVFGNKERLERLELITHPRIRAAVRKFQESAAETDHKLAFYDVPLLFEKNLVAQFDSIVCVVASPEVVLERLKLRESWTDEEIRKRLAHQYSQETKEQGAQYVLHNSGSLKELEAQVQNMINDLLKGPKKNPHKK